MQNFFADCKTGLKEEGNNSVQLPGKHSIYAKPSETKVVSRPEREGGVEDSDNLGAGKEKVGRRMDENAENDDDLLDDDLSVLEDDEDKVIEEEL